MVTIILKPRKLLLLFIFTLNCSSFLAHGFINQSLWEANLMPVLEGMPSIDNGNDIYGGRIAITNFFYNYSKNRLELGVDASITHLRTSRKKDEAHFSKSITILSPAIIGRWYFAKFDNIEPFVNIGIGPSYLSNTNFEGRDLGIKFSFQDIGGIGIKSKNLVVGLYIIHFSNASLHDKNRGITIPFSLNIAYRF